MSATPKGNSSSVEGSPPTWVAERQPQNAEYWRTVYHASSVREVREEAGEAPPPYHDWWTPY